MRCLIQLSALGIALTCAVLAFVLLTKTETSISLSEMSLRGQIEYVERLFDRHSPEESYALFKQQVSEESMVLQHPLAHVFGEVLYAQRGIEGFSICDSSFGFGCFHSFIGTAISENGIGVVRELDSECVTRLGEDETGCFHGIGHGLLSYYGYGTEGITQSLSLCAELFWKHPISGCSDGVFMEYNFRTMEVDPAKRYRPFAVDERYEPCVSIDLYKEACYFSLPAWWATDSRARPESVLGMYCSEIGVAAERVACFRGIGYALLPLVGFDADAGIVACNQVEKSGRLWCREGLAWALFSDPVLREHAGRVCDDGLTREAAATCTAEYLFAVP